MFKCSADSEEQSFVIVIMKEDYVKMIHFYGSIQLSCLCRCKDILFGAVSKSALEANKAGMVLFEYWAHCRLDALQ